MFTLKELFSYTMIALANGLELYLSLIFVQYSIGWITSINWYREPYYTICKLTDPFVLLFEGIFPQILGVDISLFVATLCLQCLITICKMLA
uniref:hypothetical protein n=1 Tax=Glaucosphaera vacuolata TaxID=38265 RepID=UPI001FCE1C32|nr:hypothetical protein MW444_pgp001 [Glaucosphaera vacuolata]UNJ18759.1 hypothetical protein [Glaucosphaera vacuolata]